MAKTKNKLKTPPLLEESYVEDHGINDTPCLNNAATPLRSKKTTTKETAQHPSVLEYIQYFYRKLQTDPYYLILSGSVLILLSIYLLLAFISFFYTWQEDFDKVTSPLSVLFSYETEVQNWCGTIGAFLSHIFIYRFYGIASMAIPVALFLWGINKVRLKSTSFNLVLHTFFWMIWLSLTLSFFMSEQYPFAGGNYGDIMNRTLIHYMGTWGLLTTLLFAPIIYFTIHPQPIQWIKHFLVFKHTTNTVQNNEPANTPRPAENPINQTFPASPLQEDTNSPDNIIVIEEKTEETKTEAIPPSIENPEAAQANNLSNEPLFTIENPTEEPSVITESADKNSSENKPPADEKHIEDLADQLVAEQGEFNPLAELSDYVYPTLDLLKDYGSSTGKITQDELLQNKDKIVKTLRNYGIEIQEIRATIGPTVTLYEIIPAPGVRIARIKNLEDDIALSLAALGIRIIAPMPGKGTIGIEVPNQNPEIVSMKNVLSSEKFQHTTFELPLVLGKTVNNEVYMADLAKMPHLLMAGATGQGKSVGINAILLSLLYKKHPAELKFVLVDPKKVELTLYHKIERHFLAKLPNSEESIITDTKKVIHTLNSLTIEMDNRYALLQDAQVRNIKEYNQKFIKRRLNPNDGHRYLPYIVVVIDEFADLIMTAGKEIEGPIARLAQLARAIGIHLVIATQRPSVNIITGVIKANFPARIAFKVSSKIDSRTILDAGGAEQLIGRGDMLYNAGSDLIRLQCAFVDTPEVEKVTEFIGIQRGYPTAFLLPEYVDENEESTASDIDLSERDKLFDEAARLVVQFQQGSASFLQRKLKIGFNRAGRLIDEMEKAGIVGKFEGAKQREVLIKDMQQLEDWLQKLNKN